MVPKKYSFIKENVIIGKRKWKFQFGVVVARRKKISNISRRSAAKREGESQFLPPRAAGGPLKENSIEASKRMKRPTKNSPQKENLKARSGGGRGVRWIPNLETRGGVTSFQIWKYVVSENRPHTSIPHG